MTVLPLADRARPAERIERRTLLGLRLLDAATGALVSDGLRLTLRRADGAGDERVATAGPSGVFSFHSIPGLTALENPDLGLPAPAGPTTILVTGLDRRGRYLPWTLGLDLPRDEPLAESLLFAAAAAPAPPGWAVLRTRLGDAAAAGTARDAALAPAAWARIDAAIDGEIVGTGLSDARGEAVVAFPLPDLELGDPDDDEKGSGGGDGGSGAASVASLESRRWTLEVSVRYAPAARTAVTGRDWPELRSVLEQPAARVYRAWPDTGAPEEAASLETTLEYGRVARVATADRDALWVEPPSS